MFPILIQMPFFSAIYFAAQHTEGVSEASLGIALLSKLILILPAQVFSTASNHSFYTELKTTKENNQENGSHMSPLMIVMCSIFSPASVTLSYWVVGGFMMILQQFIVNYITVQNFVKSTRKNLQRTHQTALARM